MADLWQPVPLFNKHLLHKTCFVGYILWQWYCTSAKDLDLRSELWVGKCCSGTHKAISSVCPEGFISYLVTIFEFTVVS